MIRDEESLSWVSLLKEEKKRKDRKRTSIVIKRRKRKKKGIRGLLMVWCCLIVNICCAHLASQNPSFAAPSTLFRCSLPRGSWSQFPSLVSM